MPKARVTVESCLAKAREYYLTHLAGGSLHIVLDDGNTERSHVEFCREWAINERDADGLDLADDLLELSADDVARVYQRLWDYEDAAT